MQGLLHIKISSCNENGEFGNNTMTNLKKP